MLCGPREIRYPFVCFVNNVPLYKYRKDTQVIEIDYRRINMYSNQDLFTPTLGFNWVRRINQLNPMKGAFYPYGS